MQKLLLILALSLGFCGCSLDRAASRWQRQTATQYVEQDGQGVTVQGDESPKRVPATARAKSSPVAAAVSRIVHWMEFAGVVCLVAAAALFYFGMMIPAVKCAVAGVVLPVSAVWFNYHYGLVIGGVLVSAAAGFVFAVNRKHPEYLAKLESKIRSEIK